MKMFVWKTHAFLAVAHAYSVSQARLMLRDYDLDEAHMDHIESVTPEIWHGVNCEVVTTDSAALEAADKRESEARAKVAVLEREIVRLRGLMALYTSPSYRRRAVAGVLSEEK